MKRFGNGASHSVRAMPIRENVVVLTWEANQTDGDIEKEDDAPSDALYRYASNHETDCRASATSFAGTRPILIFSSFNFLQHNRKWWYDRRSGPALPSFLRDHDSSENSEDTNGHREE